MEMEIGAEKTKLMTNNTSGIVIDVKIKNQMVQTVQSEPSCTLASSCQTKAQARSTGQNSPDNRTVSTLNNNNNNNKTDRRQLQNLTDMLPSHLHLSLRMCDMSEL